MDDRLLAWLLTLSPLLGAAGGALRRPGPQEVVLRVSGSTVVALGARVTLDRT